MTIEWMHRAALRYEHCIKSTLHWILERPAIAGGFLNTKVNPLTGLDYDNASGLRGPRYTYGWIQGRGLEALVSFAEHFRETDPELSIRLSERARPLYHSLSDLQKRDGHAYFLYDQHLNPIRQGKHGTEPQNPAEQIFTYSDAFVAKGLLAGSLMFCPENAERYALYVAEVVTAIDDSRFQMDETQPLTIINASTQPDDFGPKMILLGAAGLMAHCDHLSEAVFAERFVSEVLNHHYDQASGLLLNIPGQDACNVGHAVELCGFAFEHLRETLDRHAVEKLLRVLINSLNAGIQGPGVALSISSVSGELRSEYFPWWSLPEAIRACSLGVQISDRQALTSLWKRADDAFFSGYWLPAERYAYQTRNLHGPVDYVPATPDLDPGYHTGLSLLASINAITTITEG